jgi:hypothetical protein
VEDVRAIVDAMATVFAGLSQRSQANIPFV